MTARKLLAFAVPPVVLTAMLAVSGWTSSADRVAVEQVARPHRSDPGYELSRRIAHAMAAVHRGTISTRGGGQVVTAAWDETGGYRAARFTGGWVVARGASAWTRREGEACWQRTSAAALRRRPLQVGYMLALLGLARERRFAAPRARPDGTTALGWHGYWSRGTAIVDKAGRITALDAAARAVAGGRWSTWRYTLSYPDKVERINDVPRCT